MSDQQLNLAPVPPSEPPASGTPIPPPIGPVVPPLTEVNLPAQPVVETPVRAPAEKPVEAAAATPVTADTTKPTDTPLQAPAEKPIEATPATPGPAPVAEAVSVTTLDEAALNEAVTSEADVQIENLYTFNLAQGDRSRLVAQSQLFSQFVRLNARTFISRPVKRFLDIGCGEGQLTFVLGQEFPGSQGIGMDVDAAAIEGAKKRKARGVPNLRASIEFMVGNASEELPAGPFDLIYMSMVMLYLRDPEKMLRAIYSALAPGGFVWIKDVDEKSVLVATHDPTYRELSQVAYSSCQKAGLRGNLGVELPVMMVTQGFDHILRANEVYELSSATLSGRVALSNSLSSLYNLAKLVGRIGEMSEEEYMKKLRELLARADRVQARQVFPNILARRPIPL